MLSILDLSKKLITIKTDPDNQKALQDALEIVQEELGGFTIEKFEKNGSKSILIYSGNKRPNKFKVILNGHLDVIPGKEDQYFPKVEGNKLYGVGSMDMKSNVACLIAVFRDVSKIISYPLGLQIVTDEEVGGFGGTLHQLQNGVLSEFVIAGETTNFDIAHQAKGIILIEISFTGVTAHGAYPRNGDNAIRKAQIFLEALKNLFPIIGESHWRSTINLSKIDTSNKSFNKIPDDCCVSLDIRYIPGERESILKKIGEISGGAHIRIIADESALCVEKDNHFVQQLKKTTEILLHRPISLYGVNGSSDARHYGHIGCPSIEFGPIGGGIGTDDERIDIDSLTQYYNIIKQFLLNLNSV